MCLSSALAFATSGHAAVEAQPLIPIALTWLHLAATSLWAGGLLIFALTMGLLLAERSTEQRGELLALLVGRFSTLALVSAPTAHIDLTLTPVPSRPFDETRSAGDLQVRLRVEPSSIGDNRFAVTVTDQKGSVVTTQLVRLTFKMCDMDMGTNMLQAAPGGGGDYQASGSPLSMIGDWEVTVLARRAGTDDVEVVFVVPVGE